MKRTDGFLATALLAAMLGAGPSSGADTAPRDAATGAEAVELSSLRVVHPLEFQSSAAREVPALLANRGNRLVNRSNQVVQLKGLMIPEPARLAERGQYGAGLFAKLRGHGANVVRIPVHPRFWKQHPDYIQRFLDPSVQWAAECGLYVIIDWHSIGNPQTGYAPESPDLFCHTKAMTLDFWNRVAVRYQAAPHVLFEIFNEPARISGKEWRDFANETVKLIRSRGAKQPIVVDGLEYGRDLSWVLREPVAGENILYASHIFPAHAASGWDRDFGEVSRRYPVLITEWGFIAEPDRIDSSHKYLKGNAASYGDPLLAYLDRRGIGWVACWYDNEWEPAMFLKGNKGYTRWGEFINRELNSAARP